MFADANAEGRTIILIAGAAMLYFMIFHTGKWKEVNDAMRDNLNDAGKRLDKGVRWGAAIFKMFRRK